LNNETVREKQVKSVELGLFASRVAAICEEMGALLGRVAFSPNIRDRLDYSCALFNHRGQLLGQATHIPVHLGSMASAMAGLVSNRDWRPGDMLILNDPFQGGTHLPDVTLVAPVFVDGEQLGYIANRAHHADIGCHAPGSMPLSRTLAEEGKLIEPSWLMRGGKFDEDMLQSILQGLTSPETSRGDINAQVAANLLGVKRLQALIGAMGVEPFTALETALQQWARTLVETSLSALPAGRYHFLDYLDGDGFGNHDIPVAVTVDIDKGGVRVDFSGTAKQVTGNLNCPWPVTAAAVFYVFRCLLPAHTPACHGAMQGIRVEAPAGSLVNARPPAAVAAGNVETSSRIVDVVCGALAKALAADGPGPSIPAASQGTMNNLAMGSRGPAGWDYYETLAGGMGAAHDCDGRSATHSHMTNTLNTPVEVLELNYPLRILRYAVRRGSGGAGRHRGGDGVVRAYRFLEDTEVSLLGERRRHPPWGLAGGASGRCGRDELDTTVVAGKGQFKARAGQVLTLFTPGGGGYGPPAPDS
jgi:N-methylhydantoinase B